MKPKKPLRVMAVHGVGDHHTDHGWKDSWRSALAQGICRWNPDLAVEYDFVTYDDLFEAAQPDDGSAMSWLWAILGSDVLKWLGRRRGLGNQLERARDELRWTAGMVVQWMRDKSLRHKTRNRIRARIQEFQPDVLCAHSLGSLVTYDALARRPSAATRSMVLVTFGSQIGNRCVQANFPGGQTTRLPVRHWYHLYNRHDDIFTARICLAVDNFTEVNTPFNLAGLGDHTATAYLAHAAMSEQVWRVMLESERLARSEFLFHKNE